ncbi:MAG TPA: hypothetical protein PLP88_05950 [Bacteroidales bacterium]|nr:hypothetical protein [Bacteroidales bacterium]
MAGEHWRPVGARATALGSASVSMADNWSVHNNQAGMAFYNRPAVGFFYENNFMLKELGYQSAMVTLPTRYGVFGGNITYTGDAAYSETNAGIAYARAFGNRFAAGLQLDYLHTGLGPEYGSAGIATFELGLMTKISGNLTFGAHIFNPLSAKISGFYDERIASVMRAGFTYTFSEALLMTAEVYKNYSRQFNSWPAPSTGFLIKVMHVSASLQTHSNILSVLDWLSKTSLSTFPPLYTKFLDILLRFHFNMLSGSHVQHFASIRNF